MGKILLCCIALMVSRGMASFASVREMCTATPAAAIQSIGIESPLMTEGRGYRVTSVRWDPVLNQRWATVARCDHPEWPGFSVRMSEARKAPHQPITRVQEEQFSDVPVVRAGDVVHLWRQEHLVRIEAVGVAEENGSFGKTIRVRLLRRNTEGQSTEKQFSGIVRGPLDVEMQP